MHIMAPECGLHWGRPRGSRRCRQQSRGDRRPGCRWSFLPSAAGSWRRARVRYRCRRSHAEFCRLRPVATVKPLLEWIEQCHADRQTDRRADGPECVPDKPLCPLPPPHRNTHPHTHTAPPPPTHTQTHRHRHTCARAHTHTLGHSLIYLYKWRRTKRERKREREREREREGEKERKKERKKERERERERERGGVGGGGGGQRGVNKQK